MLVTGNALYAGSRSGNKNGKRWARAVFDNPKDLMDRIQIFAREDALIDTLEGLDAGCNVHFSARIYTNKEGFLGASLVSIEAV